MSKSIRGVTLGVIWAMLTAALLLLVGLGDIPLEISQILIIVSGMATMGFFSAFQRLMDPEQGSQSIHITFNELLLSKTISELLPMPEGASARSTSKVKAIEQPWDVNAGQLVGIDNALALARLRMDIERELRRVAHDADVDLTHRPVGAVLLARELMSREILPVAIVKTLEEVVTVCNRGIHREEVPDELAGSVVRVGGQLLEKLSFLP